nr:hypothetical protein Iba_chr04bCG18870 [Ipomoea batatas]
MRLGGGGGMGHRFLKGPEGMEAGKLHQVSKAASLFPKTSTIAKAPKCCSPLLQQPRTIATSVPSQPQRIKEDHSQFASQSGTRRRGFKKPSYSLKEQLPVLWDNHRSAVPPVPPAGGFLPTVHESENKMAGELPSNEKPSPEFILRRIASKGSNRKSARVEQSPERGIPDTARARWPLITNRRCLEFVPLRSLEGRRSTANVAANRESLFFAAKLLQRRTMGARLRCCWSFSSDCPICRRRWFAGVSLKKPPEIAGAAVASLLSPEFFAEADDRKLPVPKSRGHRNFRCQRCWLLGLHRRTLSSTVNKSPEITELLRRCFRRCRSPELLSRLFSPMLALYRIAFFVVVGLYAEALFLYCRVAHAWSSSVDVARSSLKAHVGASPLTRRHYEISAGITLSLKPLEFLAVNAA